MPDEPETPGSTPPDPGYDSSGVPTFESVREKIENRYATSLGDAELDAESPEGRSVAEQYDERERAAAERLAQIRASMRPDEGET
ncbi:PspA/IM30 family protein [Mycobacterium seoulense]|uniref:PspA/IM30 family protein n=1 Tax=Mycobacterium seoulense TaxID=386911 RepID=UPI003CE8B132